MKMVLLISTFSYFAFILFVSIFLKRRYKIHYDRKTLVSGLFVLIAAMALWMGSSLDTTDITAMAYSEKVYWTVFLVCASNAVIQFILWLVFTFIRQNNLARMPRFIFNIIGLILFIGITLYTLKTLFAVDLSALLITSTVLSAIIGLSLQDTLTNLFAGLSLQIESPFKVDDWVNLGGYEGKVVSQNWRSLTLITRSNHRVSLPNKAIAEEKIVNYSRPTLRQIHNIFVELDYSHPPNFVKKVLCDLLNEIKEVEIDQIAFPYVVSYEASGIKYCLKYWIDDYSDVINIQDIVLSRLWYKLQRNGIKIPYTIQEIHMELKNHDSEETKKIEKNKHVEHVLKNQKWLSGMEDSQIKILANNAMLLTYAQNDDLVTQGESGDSMFIISKGSAKVIITGNYESEVLVADKNEGDFFGEMTLLTGDPRTATVRAKEDMEVIIINKEAFSEILLKDSKILELLVSALEQNQSGLTRIIEEEQKNSNVPIKSAREMIMNKILNYLDL